MPSKPPRAYIDSCYFIDVIRGKHATVDKEVAEHLPFIEKLLLAGMNGDVELWASTLIITECLAIEKHSATVPMKVQEDFKKLFTGGSPIKLQAVDVFIAERARALRWDDGLSCGGGADMVHLATALELGCEEFITTNKKRGPLNSACTSAMAARKLRVITAPQTALLPPHYLTPLLDETK